jgi:hypothetical protein
MIEIVISSSIVSGTRLARQVVSGEVGARIALWDQIRQLCGRLSAAPRHPKVSVLGDFRRLKYAKVATSVGLMRPSRALVYG